MIVQLPEKQPQQHLMYLLGSIVGAVYIIAMPKKSKSHLTSGIQFLQVCRATDGMHYPRLVYCTLHLSTLLPVLGAQSVVASGSERPIRLLLRDGGLREDCSILKPGHRHFLWVETLHIAVKSQGEVFRLRGHN